MRKERKNRSKIAENRAITRKRSRKQSTPEISDELFVGEIAINPNGFGFVKVLSEDENGTPIDRKLNVAVTRARRQMFVLGVPEALEASPLYSALMREL